MNSRAPDIATYIYARTFTREAIKPGTERNGTEPEVIDAQYRRVHWTRGQKLALIRTVCLSVRTLISRSVAATKTGQAQAESHVKRMNC